MAIKLFYETDNKNLKPKYGLGNPSNDYGLGFYMTPSFEAAKLWATKFESNGYVYEYGLDLSNLNVLYLNNENEIDVLRWITLLAKHRFDFSERNTFKKEIDWLENNFAINLSGYDVIVGYRADDSYFSYSKAFVSNQLSFESLTKAMKIGKLGIQYVAISKKAFDLLVEKDVKEIAKSNDYEIFRNKTLIEYHEIKNNDKLTNVFLRDLMRKYEKI